jgi:hypothetical protein
VKLFIPKGFGMRVNDFWKDKNVGKNFSGFADELEAFPVMIHDGTIQADIFFQKTHNLDETLTFRRSRKIHLGVGIELKKTFKTTAMIKVMV